MEENETTEIKKISEIPFFESQGTEK